MTEKSLKMEIVAPFTEAIAEIKKAGAISSRLCYQCGKCDVYCPWNKVRQFSIRKIVREAALGLVEIEEEEIWRCTTCGLCPSQCPRGVNQIDVGVSLRRVASAYGVLPASARAIRAVKGGLATEGNPIGEKREKRASWSEGLKVAAFEEEMEYLYFVGCYYSYDPRLKKVAVATVDVLNTAGVSFGILKDKESCCGESIRKAGGEDVFRMLAKNNIKTFIDAGVKKIIVSSPHCYQTLKNEYKEFMVNFEIVHITQLAAQFIKEKRLRLKNNGHHKVTYHDPCYLGRHNGVYEEPRSVLREIPGLELKEMEAHGHGSLCCGGGGGRIWMETPRHERFSEIRLRQAMDTGAETLTTSCPYCIANFEDSRLALEDDKAIQVKDVIEVLRDSLVLE